MTIDSGNQVKCFQLSLGVLAEKRRGEIRLQDVVASYIHIPNCLLRIDFNRRRFYWDFYHNDTSFHAFTEASEVSFSAEFESHNTQFLVLTLKRPPFYVNSVDGKLKRAICDARSVMPTALRDGQILIGHWLTYVFDMETTIANRNWIQSALNARLVKFRNRKVVLVSRNALSYCDMPQAYYYLGFELRYLVECLISNELVAPKNLTSEFFTFLRRMDESHAAAFLREFIMVGERVHAPIRLLKRFTQMTSNILDSTLPEHCARIRRVIVTPTKILVQIPTVEMTNRVVRHHKHLIDQFLRVEFSDDDFGQVMSAIDLNERIHHRIYEVLLRGIKVAGKKYEFLAFSSSQLREHQCWFFASDEHGENTAEKIRNWMGQFDGIPSVAKRAARMGQCFSTTMLVSTLRECRIIQIRDIEQNGFNFTDGVGKISGDLLHQAKERFSLPFVPSAIQIRLGGYKGMLAYCPELERNTIALRKSQNKFPTQHSHLEVVRVATLGHCYLNRQVIVLLSSLGIPDAVFIKLTAQMISNLNEMFNDQETAINVLQTLQASECLVAMVNAGLMTAQDPFLMNMLELTRMDQLRDLKSKARIYIKDGALLTGVVDEVGVLGENEIFVKLADKVLTGRCLVTRNPCFHPGDIRIVEAVDHSDELGHLVDCIVFPSGILLITLIFSGRKRHPQPMQWRRLGWRYFHVVFRLISRVIWDPELIPEYTVEPMEPDPKIIGIKDPSIDAIKRFFVDYIISDNLGQIANSHLALSDLLHNGPFNEKCIALAHLHSQAVDFPKTGVRAPFPQILRAKEYPDFMNKQDKSAYNSVRVLGTIYRMVTIDSMHYHAPRLLKAFLVPGYEAYLLNAREVIASYNHEVRMLMHQFNASHEVEIVSGLLINPAKLKRRKPYEARRKALEAYTIIAQEFRQRFEEDFVNLNSLVERRKKASAWYYVAYSEDLNELYNDEPEENDLEMKGIYKQPRLLSFPWLVYNILVNIIKAKESV